MMTEEFVDCGIFRRHFKTEEHKGIANLRMTSPEHAITLVNMLNQREREGSGLMVPNRDGQGSIVIGRLAKRATMYKDKWREEDHLAVRPLGSLLEVPDQIVSMDERNLDNNRPLKCAYCGEGGHAMPACPEKKEQIKRSGSLYCPACYERGFNEAHWYQNCERTRYETKQRQLVEHGVAAGSGAGLAVHW